MGFLVKRDAINLESRGALVKVTFIVKLQLLPTKFQCNSFSVMYLVACHLTDCHPRLPAQQILTASSFIGQEEFYSMHSKPKVSSELPVLCELCTVL